jgi:hypothetical protein
MVNKLETREWRKTAQAVSFGFSPMVSPFLLQSLSAQQCHLVFILEEADTVHLEAFLCCLFQLCGGPIIIWCGTTHNNSPLRYPNCNIWLCNYQNINQLFVYTVIQETNYWLWLRVCHAVDHSAYLLFFFIMVK